MLPLDVYLTASANPEDYTNRGRIITPLKDRYGAQVRTHYPRSADDEMAIVEQEYLRFPDASARVAVAGYMKELIAEITRLARRSPEINQRSGVSLRVSISNFETVLGNTFKRGLRCDERASPRISDLPSIVASTTGKIELETVEEGAETKVVEGLIKKAVLNVFGRYFGVEEFDDLVYRFEADLVVEVGSEVPSAAYVEQLGSVDGLSELVRRLGPTDDPASFASATELVLEGLHLNRRLNRDSVDGKLVYRR